MSWGDLWFLISNLEKNEWRNQKNGEKDYKSLVRIKAYSKQKDLTALKEFTEIKLIARLGKAEVWD